MCERLDIIGVKNLIKSPDLEEQVQTKGVYSTGGVCVCVRDDSGGMRAAERSDEHGHTFNRTKTCTVSSQITLELHGTRLGTSWMAAFLKNERKITT